jgi:hypothetical protein
MRNPFRELILYLVDLISQTKTVNRMPLVGIHLSISPLRPYQCKLGGAPCVPHSYPSLSFSNFPERISVQLIHTMPRSAPNMSSSQDHATLGGHHVNSLHQGTLLDVAYIKDMVMHLIVVVAASPLFRRPRWWCRRFPRIARYSGLVISSFLSLDYVHISMPSFLSISSRRFFHDVDQVDFRTVRTPSPLIFARHLKLTWAHKGRSIPCRAERSMNSEAAPCMSRTSPKSWPSPRPCPCESMTSWF